jgi:ectoine hydroxylase-related dioxygenase (phytanoyl-CoA dioxygenase family)
VERFQRDGFVQVPDLLAPDEVERFGRVVDAAVEKRAASRRRPLEELSRYEQSFLQVINLWEDFPEVRPLTFHPRITAAAAALLGAPRVRLWHDQALYKEAGGRETDAHQDHPYWPIEEADALTAWIPFDDVTVASGATGFVPGSHRFGVRRFVNIFFGQPEDLLGSAARGVEPVFVEPRRGSVVFHHGLTMHLARANRSDRVRRVHTAIYFRDGCTRAARGAHPCVDRARIAPGAPVDSDVTPIAWPREPGDLPPRPAHRVGPDALGRHLWPPDE